MSGSYTRPMPTSGGIFKSAAVEVLRRARRLMTTGEICRLALDWGLLTCSGKTPEATMASAMYGDIKRKDRNSLFIRPQEGMFGLREWLEQVTVPHVQQESSFTAAASAPTEAPACITPAKRGSICSTSLPSTVAHMGGGSKEASGKPKKARRSRGSDNEDEDWNGAEPSNCDQHRRPDGDQDEGQLGRLKDARGQAALEPRLSDAQLERTHPGDSAAGVPLQHNALLVGLEPLDLPNLRPTSAEGSRLQHSCPSSCLRSSQGGASFLSPPLHAVLQSPVPRAATGPDVTCGGEIASFLSPCTALPHMRSSTSGLPLLTDWEGTPGSLAGLLSPPQARKAPAECSQPVPEQTSSSCSRQRQALSALKGAAAAAAAGAAAAAAMAVAAASAAPVLPVELDVQPSMVPVDSSALSAAMHAEQLVLGLDLLRTGTVQPPLRSCEAPATIAGPDSLSNVLQLDFHTLSGAELGGMTAVPEILLGLPGPSLPKVPSKGGDPALCGLHTGCWSQASSSQACYLGRGGVQASLATANKPPAGPASVGHGSGSIQRGGFGVTMVSSRQDIGTDASHGSSVAAIVQKIREVEEKVQAVEQKWGLFSLKTGRAFWLLHHACRHPQAAVIFRDKAEEALQRASHILQQADQSELTTSQLKDYRDLLDDVQGAHASGA